jgi:hypothetical protein
MKEYVTLIADNGFRACVPVTTFQTEAIRKAVEGDNPLVAPPYTVNTIEEHQARSLPRVGAPGGQPWRWVYQVIISTQDLSFLKEKGLTNRYCFEAHPSVTGKRHVLVELTDHKFRYLHSMLVSRINQHDDRIGYDREQSAIDIIDRFKSFETFVTVLKRDQKVELAKVMELVKPIAEELLMERQE